MNDSEAACFGADALENHCRFATSYDSLCDRKTVTSTSSFEFCFTYTTSEEKTQGNSLNLDMVLLTRKQLPVVLKLDLYSSFFGGGGGDKAPRKKAGFKKSFKPCGKL